MISFKGILRYVIYIFIGGWMFLLGIMVGRGTSPVTFDTEKFQKRLEAIAGNFGGETGGQKKIDLKFYDVLDHPVPEEGLPPKTKPLEIIPKKETRENGDTRSLKTSKKKQTFKKHGKQVHADIKASAALETKAAAPDAVKSKPVPVKTNTVKKVKAPEPSGGQNKGRYTIQVAAYKEFKDAITQMAILEEKGFSAYRVKGQKDGITWYRVRTGSFETYDAAKQFKEKLNKAKINSMIIKRDDDEDIKG